MRSFFLLFFLFGSLFAKPVVLVSVAPQKFLVESIAPDLCTIEVLVPAGASPHSYEPKISQIHAIKDAAIWFRIGESFEEKLLPLVAVIVDQRDGLELIGCRCHGGADPHIWLSPKMLRQEARQICSALEKILEMNLQDNLTALIQKIDYLEQKLLLQKFPNEILVSHPAFGYFCRDFKIEQLSVEMDGQEPSVRQLTRLMDEVKRRGIKRIYLQEQYSKKGGQQIARQLGLEMLDVDPYEENVLANLERMGEVFCD